MKFIITILLMSLYTFNSHAEKLTIAVEDDAAPWSYKDGSGIANDIVKEIFKLESIDILFNVYPYSRCKSEVERGEHLACFTTSKDSETEKIFNFPKSPLINPHFVLIGLEQTFNKENCQQIENSGSNKIYSVLAVKGYEYISRFNKLVEFKKINPTYVSSEKQMLEMLAANRSELAIATIDESKSLEYLKHLNKNKVSFYIACDLGTMPGYLAFSKKFKNSDEYLKKFDEGFEKLKKSGKLKKITAYWNQKLIKESRP